ncbi:MAG: GNAT family N-acetyltransferase [Rhodocyclales bacterium]|nr:GNAT family N-acetyltransferase [Rhodocyclales bacterium]
MNSEKHYLSTLFEPASVAVIGASETPGSIGSTLMRNMLDADYGGELFPVNPKHETIFGRKSYPSIDAIPQRIDLAVICTPAASVPTIVETCGRAGCRNVMIISGGFASTGPRGEKLEQAVLENARRHGMRIVGPNCLGFLRPTKGIDLSFAHGGARAGSIGLISQSGALCTAILDWARPNGVGFSTVISLGAEADIDFGEALDFMASDPHTESIFLYIEGIRNARRFMSALRAAARCKPVLLIKVGRHPAGEKAIRSHTGALVGADDVFDAALRRAGVVRLNNIDQMYAAASALFTHFQPHGRRLAIITNGGGPGAMAADHAEDIGIPLAAFSPATIAKLDAALPPGWSRTNPVDLLGDADPARYSAALTACIEDETVDGGLIILAPQAMTDPTQAARAIIDIARKSEKPLLTCWMGEDQVGEARKLLKGAGIPTFRTPEPAVQLFAHISNYYLNRQLLLQAPPALSEETPPHLESARLVIETALLEGRKVLSEMESKSILAAFQIPIAQTVIARSASEAMVLAEQIGLPVAMKIDSPQIVHKSNAGGIRLNLDNLAAVRDAWHSIMIGIKKSHPDAILNGVAIEPMIEKANGRELMVGMMQDTIFGPTIVLSSGGNAGNDSTADQRDRAVALPPLNPVLIEDMLASAHSSARLGEFRHMPPVSQAALEKVLLRISAMVCELPWIRKIDINPLIVDENGAVAVDACITIDHLPPGASRYDHMAIYPYPSHLETTFQASDGRCITLRPIKPEDAQLEREFFLRLSPEARYLRFMNTLREISPAQLARLTQIDYDRELALVAILEENDEEKEIGVCRYAMNPDGESCEFAIVIADDWHGKGLARRLMVALIDAARQRGFKAMTGDFLVENTRMLKFVTRLGFVLSPHVDDPGLKHGVLLLN